MFVHLSVRLSNCLSICLIHYLPVPVQVAGDYGTVTDSPPVRETPRGTALTTSVNVSTSEDTAFYKTNHCKSLNKLINFEIASHSFVFFVIFWFYN